MKKKIPIQLTFSKIMLIQLMIAVMSFCSTGVFATSVYAQNIKFNINMNKASVASVLNYISANSDFSILYDSKIIENLPTVTINLSDAAVDQILSKCFENSDIKYVIKNKTIILNKEVKATSQPQQPKKVTIKGKVLDEKKKPIPGATVIVMGTTQGAIANETGTYTIEKVSEGAILEVSFVGYIRVTKKVEPNMTTINFELKEDAMKVDDVVVAGYFPKSKNSFTGAEVTVKGDALRQVGSLNFMQAISVFDPSVRSIPNNEYGSDPNRVPDITIHHYIYWMVLRFRQPLFMTLT
ncbi:MAG: carboxypeptidase-like regulatory domain-containing protein [Rikenellaceae bacterium]